jgi:hypothetical protein
VRGGPGLAGLGAGVTVDVTSAFSLVLELNGLVGFPHFSAIADGHAGFQVNFN